MASFTIYDPRLKSFRVLNTANESDLPFEQQLLINILIELRVQTEYLQQLQQDPPPDDPDEVRASIVQETD